MKSVLWNVWKPSKGLVIHDLDTNLVAFQFFSEFDRDFILNEGPWAFDGCILLLKQMTGVEVLSEVSFSTARFWVKAYDVLGMKQIISFRSNACFWVDIDITKPLRRGLYIKIADKQIWVKFRYVKLSDFCYDCERLGYVIASRDLVQAEDGDGNLQYGVWLHASPLKSPHRSNEA